MPGTKSIRHIVEETLASYLSAQSGLSGVQILTGDSNATQVQPKAVVLCDSASSPADLPEGLGNFSCSVRVTIFSNADDTTLAQHRARCASIYGNMNDLASIQAAFVATGDATAYDVTFRSEDEGVVERSWATSFSYDVLTVLAPA